MAGDKVIRDLSTQHSDSPKMLMDVIDDSAIRGVPVRKGERILVDAADGRVLGWYFKAEEVVLAGPSPQEIAAALEQARADLLERIAAAQSVEELEKVISEDPEIIAAYERRLVEIDAFESAEAAKAELLTKIAAVKSAKKLAALIDDLEAADVDVRAAYDKRLAEFDAAEKAAFLAKIAEAETAEAVHELLGSVNPDEEIQAAADKRLEELAAPK